MLEVLSAETANELWRSLFEFFVSEEGRRSGRIRRAFDTDELLHVVFELRNPRQRWTTCRKPAMNLPFALAEVLWILRGRSDAGFLEFWNSSYKLFAGEAESYHGAYGRRLRIHFGIDQLERARLGFLSEVDTRQIVLQIWDPHIDAPSDEGLPVSTAIPCNICSLLKIRSGKLEWFQVIRSNDIYLGLPYNLVQWTFLQEILAGWLGCEVGPFHQVSDSLHLYDRDRGVVDVDESGYGWESTDDLRVDRTLSEKFLQNLEQSAERLATRDLSRRELFRVVEEAPNHQAYRNIVVVLGAESARRRNWIREGRTIIELCTNEAYRCGWSQWAARFT